MTGDEYGPRRYPTNDGAHWPTHRGRRKTRARALRQARRLRRLARRAAHK